MRPIHDDIPFGRTLGTPRDIEWRRFRHILLALACTLVAGALVLVAPMPAKIKPFVAVIVAFLPFAGIFAFRYLFFICLLFIGFAFFRFHEVWPPLRPMRMPLLLSLAVLGVLCYNLILSRRIKPYWEAELTPFIMFFFWGIVCMFMSVNFANSKQFFVDTFVKIAIMTFAIAWILRKPGQFMFLTRFFVTAGVIVGLVAISNKLNGIGLVEGTRVTIGRHLKSPLGDPNDLSLVLMFPLSFAAALIMVPRSYYTKAYGAVASIIMIWAIIATQSRGGLLGLLAVMGVVGERYIKSKVVLVAIGGVAAIGLLAMAGISDRQSGGAQEEGLDKSAQARLDTWATAWNMATQNPLFGVGWENFYQQYYFYAVNWHGKAHVVHSTWFGVLTDTGFPGFFMFITMIGIIVWRCLQNYKVLKYRRAPEGVRCASLATIAGVAGVCISGTFLTQGFTWPIYILTAVAVAVSRYTRDFKNETQDFADMGYYDEPEKIERTRHGVAEEVKWEPTKKIDLSKSVWKPETPGSDQGRTSP